MLAGDLVSGSVTGTYNDSKKPIHEVFLVVVVAMEVKRSDFYFFKKEYSIVCTTVQFDLSFLNSAWYKNVLNEKKILCSE